MLGWNSGIALPDSWDYRRAFPAAWSAGPRQRGNPTPLYHLSDKLIFWTFLFMRYSSGFYWYGGQAGRRRVERRGDIGHARMQPWCRTNCCLHCCPCYQYYQSLTCLMSFTSLISLILSGGTGKCHNCLLRGRRLLWLACGAVSWMIETRRQYWLARPAASPLQRSRPRPLSPSRGSQQPASQFGFSFLNCYWVNSNKLPIKLLSESIGIPWKFGPIYCWKLKKTFRNIAKILY